MFGLQRTYAIFVCQGFRLLAVGSHASRTKMFRLQRFGLPIFAAEGEAPKTLSTLIGNGLINVLKRGHTITE